jgi:hypothetical protein
MKRALILLNRNNQIFNHGGHGEFVYDKENCFCIRKFWCLYNS